MTICPACERDDGLHGVHSQPPFQQNKRLKNLQTVVNQAALQSVRAPWSLISSWCRNTSAQVCCTCSGGKNKCPIYSSQDQLLCTVLWLQSCVSYISPAFAGWCWKRRPAAGSWFIYFFIFFGFAQTGKDVGVSMTMNNNNNNNKKGIRCCSPEVDIIYIIIWHPHGTLREADLQCLYWINN